MGKMIRYRYGKTIIALLFIVGSQAVHSQIFLETFNEGNTAISGTDDIGGVTWTATCPTCVPPDDYWHINNGQFESQDTNGPAVWETASIDISSCNNIEITLDLEEDGTLEDCGTGCNSVDWVQLEYNIDNTGWQAPSNAFFCAGACADIMVIQADDITGGATPYSSVCFVGGNTLQLRISVQTWAASERWRIDNVMVDCSAGPTVGAGSDQTVCAGDQITLTATNPDGASISWNNGVTDGVSFTPTATDYYVVTGVLGTCSAQDSALVTINPTPTFTLSSTDATSCTTPFDGTITISGLTAGTDYDITYHDGSVVGPVTYTSDGSGEIVLTGLAPGNYTDFLVDSLGCATLNSSVITISAPGSPTVDAGNDTTICEGEQVTLSAFNPDGATLSWDNGISDGVAFTPAVGTTTYTVTADLSGCIADDVVDVTVIANTSVSVSPAGPFSTAGTPQTLSATPSGGSWSANCGSCIDGVSGEFDPSVAGVGVWEVCYEAGTVPCEDSACIFIEVIDGCALTGTVVGNPPTCFEFSDGSVTVNVSGEVGSLTFLITDSLGNQVNNGNTNTANTLSEGWYYIEVNDQAPCTYIDSVFIDDPDQLVVDLLINNPPCYGIPDGFVIVDTVENYTGNYDQISYFWTPNPNGQNGIGEDTLMDVGEGNYSLLINDQNGCSETFPFSLSYPDSLFFKDLDAEPAYCRLYSYQSGNGVLFAAASGGTPDYDYLWLNLTDSSSWVNTTWGGLNPGDYQITVTDANGCILVETITLDSLNPEADFILSSPEFTAEWEGTAPVFVNFQNTSMYFSNPNNPQADTTFFWNFGTDENWILSKSIYDEFDTVYTEGGEYEVCLVAINKNGCTDTSCVLIAIFDPLAFEPVNVFTPNGDGANDLFTFDFVSVAVVEFRCVIVNRWGVTVTEFNHISDSWDGTYPNGKNCTEGVYFYTYSGVAENGEIFSGQGNVHLINKEE
ncbi:MAG: gliding motility-associated C-terminal domain-containing protein [Crocinitomicaceae bacterium]